MYSSKIAKQINTEKTRRDAFKHHVGFHCFQNLSG